MDKLVSRRRFVRLLLAAGAALGLAGCAQFFVGDEEESKENKKKAEEKLPEDKIELEEKPEETREEEEKKANQEDDAEKIPRRELGNTGRQVSIFGLGGSFAVAGRDNPEEAEAIVNKALDLGVNYIDTAPTYGASESNLGRVIKHRREEVFLAGKTIERTYDGTMQVFEQSLERLQTDHLDLLQIHGLHSRAELDQILASGGALAALDELKSAGLINFTGLSGHKEPSILLQAINEYDFNCILLSLNPADPYYHSFQNEVLPAAEEKNMGIVAMKVAAYGHIFREEGITTMDEALGYVWSYPVDTAIVGISTLDELEENVRSAKKFKPFGNQELRRLEELVKPYQEEVNFYKKKW